MNKLSIANNEVLTITTFALWNQLNEFRAESGGNKIQHGDFLARVEDECDDLGVSDFFPHPQNKQKVRFYNLTHEQSLLVGMRESKVVRKKVLNWIKTLEKKSQPKIPTNFAEALQLAADQAKQLELAAPKVAFVDNFVESSGTKTFRQVAKILKANERLFRAFLSAEGFMYKIGREWTAYQKHIDAGRFSCTVGEKNGHAFTECKFTPKGIEYIAGKWITASST